MSDFRINKRGVAQMMRELQREFDRHPIKVAIEADPPSVTSTAPPQQVYNGPVIMGDAIDSQFAWNNTAADQLTLVAPGFEDLASVLTSVMQMLPEFVLAGADLTRAQAAGQQALAEVAKAEPNQTKVRRALSGLKKVLAPVATGVVAGTGAGAQQWAKEAVEHLSRHL